MPTIIDIDKAPSRDLPSGRGRMIRLFDPSNGANNFDVHINILEPGVRKGTIHFHRKIENAYVILEGVGEIMDKDGGVYPVKAGQAVFFKPGEPADTHEIYNTGKTQLKLVEVYSPAHPKEVYGPDREKWENLRDHVKVKNTE